ncbi:MAG: polyphosphate polymerase domain-containing protein [Oscillospiraceae bacterium]|nr:polyphosphate polymerase domain-containing protein [Oscillospiraceae bacterium]
MSETILTFKRSEKKYLLSAEQFDALWKELGPHLQPDEYPKSTVCSIYYDTDDYRMIRHSIDAPVYKAKLRLRSYDVPSREDPVFVELKKKYRGIVYKRRVALSARAASRWLDEGAAPAEADQTTREIDWLLRDLRPRAKVFLACDRLAFRDREEPELRITFDRDIRWREDDLDLTAGDRGEPLLPPGQVLMEIKIPEAMPLWLAHLLSEQSIFPVSFSKYGTCYKEHIFNTYILGGPVHAR